jgi:hypothetical protein
MHNPDYHKTVLSILGSAFWSWWFREVDICVKCDVSLCAAMYCETYCGMGAGQYTTRLVPDVRGSSPLSSEVVRQLRSLR